MYTAEVTFQRAEHMGDERVADAVDRLLVALNRNGQTLGDEWPVACTAAMVRVFVSIPERSSLQAKRANKWVKSALAALAEAGLCKPKVGVIGKEYSSLKPCTCRRPVAYVLYTDLRNMEVPLRCGGCFGPVPFYRIPPTTEYDTYEDLVFWRRTYQCCDELFIGSSVGERFAQDQLSRLDSDLTKLGLSCASTIARKTKKRCYYYLMRHYGRSIASERKRRCPGCARPWLLSEPLHAIFSFRCDKCRLLSNIAWDI